MGNKTIATILISLITTSIGAESLGFNDRELSIASIDNYNGTHAQKVNSIIQDLVPSAKLYMINAGKESDKRLYWNANRTPYLDRLYNPNVINISAVQYSLSNPYPRYEERHSLIILAAGNDGYDCSIPRECNHLSFTHNALGYETIIVGVLNKEGTELQDYSNRAGILMNDFITTPETIARGTSFGAPIVSAAAIQVMEKFGLSAEETKERLLATADDLGAPGVDPIYGHGRLNLQAALESK